MAVFSLEKNAFGVDYFPLIKSSSPTESFFVAQSSSSLQLPQNPAAEMQLLGKILLNNSLYDEIAYIKEEDFFDPFHRHVFSICKQLIEKSMGVTPAILHNTLLNNESYQELQDPHYFHTLSKNATEGVAAQEYARILWDLSKKRALLKLAEKISSNVYNMDSLQTAQEQLDEAEQELYALCEKGERHRAAKDMKDSIKEAEDLIEKISKNEGVTTGLQGLDAKIGKLLPQNLIVVAARPSIGKTALATTIALNTSELYYKSQGKIGGRVAFCSLEMSAAEIAQRLICHKSQLSKEKILNLHKNPKESTQILKEQYIPAVESLESLPLYIDDSAESSIARLSARVRRLKRRTGLDLLIVDYIQLLRASNSITSSIENRTQEISEISRHLKLLAKDLKIPVIAISQLNRAVESRADKRPNLADLRDSGAIEQDADIVVFIYREEYYLKNAKPPENETEKLQKWQKQCDEVHNKASLIVGKNRNGDTGEIIVAFTPEFTHFSSTTDDTSFSLPPVDHSQTA